MRKGNVMYKEEKVSRFDDSDMKSNLWGRSRKHVPEKGGFYLDNLLTRMNVRKDS